MVTMARTQFTATFKVIRSNNALELSTSQALVVFVETCIIHQTSCIQTPEQNGVVERTHKHLLEVLRALLSQSCVHIKY